MSLAFRSIADYWKKEYSDKIKESDKYNMPAQVKRMASMAAPGESYFYVANFHTMELEMLSDSVTKFLDLLPEKVDIGKLLSLADKSDVELIHLKEQMGKSFFIDFLGDDEVLDYKIMYTYNLRDYKNKKRLMLHQACALSTNGAGRFIHVFSIHSDISHLAAKSTRDVSFIHLDGGQSYLNVPLDNGVFNPRKIETDETLEKILSEREKEIILMFSQGLNPEEVGEKLFISPHTVRTHRKNILNKTGAKNSIQIISKCIAAGVIDPQL